MFGRNLRFGRLHSHDVRDQNHLILGLVGAPPPGLTKKYWEPVWVGDQGDTDECVAYAWAGWLDDAPIRHPGSAHPTVSPAMLYKEAQRRDDWHDRPHDGTTVRAAAQALQELGYITEYHWASTINDIINAILTVGPVIVGTDWYRGMLIPDRRNFISLSGRAEGGHSYIINGVDVTTETFRVKCSWGKDWGDQGMAYLRFPDLRRLLCNNGEACLPIYNPDAPKS